MWSVQINLRMIKSLGYIIAIKMIDGGLQLTGLFPIQEPIPFIR